MRRLFCPATFLVAFAAISVGVAKEKHTFGEVPPPSRFPGEVDYSKAAPAAVALPKVVPVPVKSNSVPVKITAPGAPVAPPAKPVKPAAQKIEPAKPKAGPARPMPETPVVASPKPKPVAEKIEPVKPQVAPPPPVRAPSQLVVAPGGGLNGKVIVADARGRFVVLNFPLGQMPATDSALDVYRNGVKVGEIKITGPQRDDNTVADVVSGELQAGDVARNR